jgi:hypothetical protein
MAPSSTYRERSVCHQDFAVSKRDEVYSVERIGDRGDPCGVPLWMGKGLET